MLPVILVSLVIGVIIGVLVVSVLPLQRATEASEEEAEMLLDALANPRQFDGETLATLHKLGYATAIDLHGPIEAGQSRVIDQNDVSLLHLNWHPQGALLRLHEEPREVFQPLFLTAWDDDGIYLRPTAQNADGSLSTASRIWRGTGWLDTAALLTQHRVENGLVLGFHGLDGFETSLSILTKLPYDLPLETPTHPLSAWVCWIQRIFDPDIVARIFAELEEAWGPDAPLAKIGRCTPPPSYFSLSELSLILESALRYDIYATAELLVAVARQRDHIHEEFVETTALHFLFLDAISIWEGEHLDTAATQWRRQEASRELGFQGLPPTDAMWRANVDAQMSCIKQDLEGAEDEEATLHLQRLAIVEAAAKQLEP